MENNIYFDEIVGKLVYDDAWYSTNIFTFNKKNVYIIFQAFEDEKLTDTQRVNYLYATKNLKMLLGRALSEIKKDTPADVFKTLVIESLYFNRYNEFGFLGEFETFDDFPIAVKFDSAGNLIEIGDHDILI